MSAFSIYNIGVFGNSDEMNTSFVNAFITDPENTSQPWNIEGSNICRFTRKNSNVVVYLYARTAEVNEINKKIPFNFSCVIIIDDGTATDSDGKLTVDSWKTFAREHNGATKDIIFLVVKNTANASPCDVDHNGTLKVCIEKRVNIKLALRILHEMLVTRFMCSMKGKNMIYM